MHTNDHDRDFDDAQLEPPVDSEHPGYETTDVNVNGVAVFLAGLFGFVLIFFVFCYGMGKVINTALEKQDGPPDKWHPASVMEGTPGPDGKRQDMTSNAEMQQKELQQMTSSFPTPRLDIDDGNQATADLHAREDLLLEHYSSDPNLPDAPWS
jgi:Na+-transporting methylmalonyl-CoA/oxaloacetate decarboxylase gamma subunit